jgi:Tol biopolymer transport system component
MGYLGVYKCGQSVLYYIAHRYGDEKIGEILHKIRNMRDFDRALKASIGIDQEELSKRWRRFFKERYWPQVARLDPPDRISTQLTDHNKEFCFINNSPSLSPNGEWIAFLSDRSDYFDVYLMRTIDGKVVRRLVRGQKSGQFEELHWLRPGITWSPDGSQIALAAKAGAQDAIHIIDVATGKIKRSLKFASDGLFSPSWSPDGSKLAVVYVQDGRSDLAYIDLETESLRLLTSDVFDDADPSWSPDGTSLLFTSNRDRETLDTTGTDPQALAVHPVEFFDIYTITLEDRQIVRLTNDKHIIRSPIWTPLSNTILYISNLSGVFNLYVRNLTTGETRAVSNVVTGCLQPSTARKSHALAFTAYYDFGYDIYLMDDPFDSAGNLTPEVVSPAARVSIDPDTTHSPSNDAGDYSQFVFDRLEQVPEESVEEEPDSSRIVRRNREESGLYTNHPYKPKLSPDYVFFSAAYSPYFKMQGSGLILFSDVLGNHNLYLSADINRNTENSNFFLQYDYLARRADLGTGFYHFAYPFYSRGVVWRDRNFGLFAQTSYPLNRFNRFELSAEYSVIERSVLSASDDTSALEIRKSTVVPHIGYVHDTSIWRRSTAPSNGSRWRLDGSFSPDIGLKRDGVVYTTFTGDWRKYFAYKKDFTFAIRLSGGGSYGSDAQMFFLGGMQNWFNPNYDNPDRDVQIDDLKDIYYSSFVGPLRGVGYYNRTGNRYLLANAEFRYPFIRDLVMGWPLPIYIRDVQGALFTDWGSAWTPGNRQTINIDPPINVSGFSAAVGYGIGLRIDLGIFPLEMDVAWSPDDRVNMVPHYYFSINTGF